jgi:hypothetical protein
MFTRLIGNKYFHSKVNNWSTLNLGNVHLNHIIKNTKIIVFPKNQNTPNQGIDSVIPKGESHAPKNMVVAIDAIMNMFINSAKKK